MLPGAGAPPEPRRTEDAAAKADRGAIASAIGEYADYLSKVKVVYE